MSFEHRIVGGDRADDGNADDKDCREDNRLRDIDSVESLDNLDVLADQLRDDAQHLFERFPVDEKQMAKFAGQFRGDDASDEVLREHVDEEMQKCLRRIELLDIAERRSMRRRIKTLLAAIGGTSALALIVTFMIHQFWFQPPEPTAGRSVPAVIGNSNMVAISKSAQVNKENHAPMMSEQHVFPSEADTQSVETDFSVIPLRTVGSVDGTSDDVAANSTAESAKQLETIAANSRDGVSRDGVSRDGVSGDGVQDATQLGPTLTFAESVANHSERAAPITVVPFAASSSTEVNLNSSVIPTGGLTGIANLPAMYSNPISRLGFGLSPGRDAMPTAEEIPELYRSASEPEMEAILDLFQMEQDGSISVEF